MLGPALIAVVLAGGAEAGGRATPPGERSQPPFANLGSERLDYVGPGREEPPPDGVTEVRIGWFGPSDLDDREGGDSWAGAMLAAEEANGEGGAAGLPVRLVPGWAESPWAGGVNRVARMVYDDRVWAIVGSIDGAATHLAEQVVAKALVTLVSPGATDKSVSYAGVPWMFTMLPGDDAQAAALAAWLSDQPEARPIVLVSATDHDARAAATELRAALNRSHLVLAAHVQCAADAADAATVASEALEPAPRAVVLVAAPTSSARLALALRQAGYRGTLLGGSNLARRAFRETAGPAAEGAIVPLVADGDVTEWARFQRAFVARFGREADFAAGAAYDGVRLTVAAVRRAGLNRARIRDEVRALAPWVGVTGEARFDNLGRNERPIHLGRIRGSGLAALP
jgi:ABC-type branched-subunit amino acid transport system substrate-binding protein